LEESAPETDETPLGDSVPGTDEAPLEEDSSASNEEDEWKSSLDELMAQVDLEMNKESTVSENGSMDDTDSLPLETAVNQDVSDVIDGSGSGDDDLEEINGLLKETDRSEAVDDDMLALLESMNDSGDHAEADEIDESFNLFGDEGSAENDKEIPGEVKEKPKKKRVKKEKSKQGFGLFGKKKNKDQSAVSEKENIDDMFAQLDNLDFQQQIGGLTDTVEPSAGDAAENDGQGLEIEKTEKPAKEKKPGFFSKLLTALTEEETDSDEIENISAENKAILNELEEEDQKEKKKKKKKDKAGRKKKGNNKTQTDSNDEDQEDEDAEEPGKKKKKVKEPRKEKKAKNENKEKPVKVLSRKNLLLLIACCGTLLACILLLSTFLPEYSDKAAARDAYYAGNYEEAYKLLYDKRLNASDKLVFNRAKTVLRLERKIISYENNLTMGRELEAVDALLQGVSCYQNLTDADEYGVRSEVDALYQQICSVLESNYGISEEEALEINAYDNQTYTRKLNSVVYGTDFVKPGEEKAEPAPSVPQDILPEEEEIISY
ncbi:MAG: hypothetical protein Q4D94_12125, partial [Bacillota bacterium]|nr:hypothetical protein [Bacillota bacterium]